MTVVGLGELLWDCFGDTRRPGGAPANVAFHAAQLGANGVICSRVGSDELGDALVQYIDERGLDTRGIQCDPDHPTGTVTVETTDAGHPTYVIHEDVAWDHLAFDETLTRIASTAAAVCFGTLAQRSDPSRRAIEQSLDAAPDALRVYDVNLRPPWHTPETIDRSLRRCCVAKLNDDEAPAVAEMFSLNAKEPYAVAKALADRYELEVVCVTRGENGCVIASGAQRIDVPGRGVEVADTVGAGDAFTAALVCGLLQEWPLPRIAVFANEVGALVACRPGAMPNLSEEFTALAASV